MIDQALIVVDVQKDFCKGGALEVPKADEIIPFINETMGEYKNVILTQDWHPNGHISFYTSHKGKKPLQTLKTFYGPQKLWPEHCIAGTEGARFHPDLDTDKATLILRKGTDKGMDSYSALYENDRKRSTGVQGYLRFRQINKVSIVGLATDVCVKYTAYDAKRCGFDVTVISKGCKGIGNVKKVLEEMKRSEIKVV